MGKIKIGRDNKRDYESVKFFAESVKPENEAADEVQQPTEPAQVDEAPAEQARQEIQEEPVQEAQQPTEPAQVDEAPAEQARQEIQEEPVQEAQQAPEKKEVPVAKQPRKKGGKR